ncbi:MAG: MATE family efflux transporter [Myxococcaceae bacterium]|nr:MATE family efflux transporter [Myxococcaceae bacterium]
MSSTSEALEAPAQETPAPEAGSAGLGTLLSLAWPVMVSRSTQVVIGLVDALMVAKLGRAALAATGAGAFNTYAVLILPMGCLFIVASFASQFHGKGDPAGARRYGFYGLAVAGITQLMCVAAIPGLPWVLSHLSLEPEVQALMGSYMAIRLLSGGAAMGMEALGNYYGGIGNTRRPMVGNVVLMVLNVFFCWLLVQGRLGAPALGVAGAAWAAVAATWLAFLGLLAPFILEGKGFGPLGMKRSEFGRMLAFGLPSGLNWFFEFFAFNVFINVVIGGLGTTALAAMMSVFQLNSISFMPAFGLATAGSVLVGQAIGAGNKRAVPGLVRLTLKAAAGWQGAVSVLYVAIPGLLLLPFASEDGGAEFLEVGARLLMLSAGWQVLDAAVNTVAESLRAAGDTTVPLLARLVIAWLVFVPGSVISVRVFHHGEMVAVGWVVAYMALLSAVLWLRLQSGAWEKVKLIEPAP